MSGNRAISDIVGVVNKLTRQPFKCLMLRERETAIITMSSRQELHDPGPTVKQVCSLVSLKRLLLACELAVLLKDWDLVARGVWRSYHLLLPLLRIPAMGHLLFQARRDGYAGEPCFA